MGCSSDMGCLGPKPREREVYVDIIETIYNEVEQMSLPKYPITHLANKIHTNS